MAQHYYSNTSTAAQLSAAIGTGDTTIQVAESGTDNGWPTSYPFTLALDFGTVGVELVDVTAKGALASGIRTWSVSRAQDGTVASAHAANVANSIRHVMTRRDLQEARQARYLQPDDTIATYIVAEGTAAQQWTDTAVGDLIIKATAGKTVRIGSDPNTGKSPLAVDSLGLTAGYVKPRGLTGTSAANFRLVGNVAGQAPTTGTFLLGDVAYDILYGGYWVCTLGGTPGTWLYPQPRGVVAWTERTTTTAAVGTTITVATSVSVPLDSSRMYEIWTSPILVESSVSGDYAQIRTILSSAGGTLTGITSLLTLANAKCETANVANTSMDTQVLLTGDITGTFQIGVAYFRNSGTGNVKLNLAVGRALQLVVTDVGPALAKQ